MLEIARIVILYMKRVLAFLLLHMLVMEVSAKNENDLNSGLPFNALQSKIISNLIDKNEYDVHEILYACQKDLNALQIKSINDSVRQLYVYLRKAKEKTHSDAKFVEFSFRYLKHKLLLKYTPNADFSRIFNHHEYDCVTGSILLCMIFDQLGVKHDIIETYSHVCVKVKTDSMNILLETTSKNGIYTNNKDIFSKIKEYQLEKKDQIKEILNSSNNQNNQGYFLNKIDLRKLIGLQYYNKSVQDLEEKSYGTSVVFAEISKKLYPSARTQGLLVYSLTCLLKDETLDFKTKSYYYKKYKNIIEDFQIDSQ
jgi:hypothetical protein